MEAGDYEAADLINSFDFNEDNSVVNPYPPQWMQLCGLCGRR